MFRKLYIHIALCGLLCFGSTVQGAQRDIVPHGVPGDPAHMVLGSSELLMVPVFGGMAVAAAANAYYHANHRDWCRRTLQTTHMDDHAREAMMKTMLREEALAGLWTIGAIYAGYKCVSSLSNGLQDMGVPIFIQRRP